MQCKALRDSALEIGNYDVAYFMVSVDSLEDNTAFAEQNRANFPVLADPGRTVSEAYGVLSERGYRESLDLLHRPGRDDRAGRPGSRPAHRRSRPCCASR